jgi:glycerol kinase
MQCLADILNTTVERPASLETTALGAAWLAGSHIGIWPDQKEFASAWHCQQRFSPTMSAELRMKKVKGWQDAMQRLTTSA